MSNSKKVSIIGSGNVGGNLARLMKDNHIDVTVGVRSFEEETSQALQAYGISVATIEDAIKASDMVVLAIHYLAVEEALTPFKELLSGKVIIDATNPLNSDWSPYVVEGGLSGAEAIQGLFPNATVVKAFQTVFADIMTADKLNVDGKKATTFINSDDDAVALQVKEITDAIGMEGVITGSLKLSRYTEGMAHLNIALAVGQGNGTNSGFMYFVR